MMETDNKMPDAIILAGGLGSRLRGVVNDRPKPMASVGGRPFLEWLILSFRAQGIQRFIFCTGYFGELIEQYFKDGKKWDVQIFYSHEISPLGTGGAIKNALPLIQSDPFIVINGDTFFDSLIQPLVDFHNKNKAHATLSAVYIEQCNRYGEMKIDDRGSVISFHEKKPEIRAGLISSGIYVFQKEILNNLPPGEASSLEKDLFPKLVGKGLMARVDSGIFLDIGTPDSYLMALGTLKDKLNMLTKYEIARKQKDRLQAHIETGNKIRYMLIECCGEAILQAVNIISDAFQHSKKVLICGNGGSAADAQHMAAEFVSSLNKDFSRRALPAIALTTDTSLLTAFANDYGFDGVFARQIEAFGNTGDVLIAISTSGNSRNIIQAVKSAKEKRVFTIGLTGEGGTLSSLTDNAIVIPSRNTQYIQEAMLAVEHLICDLTERTLFDPEYGSGLDN